MLKKGTKLYSIVNRKCPRCHEGEFLISRNPYNFSVLGKNHERCSVCNHKFEKEVGFFYGAMYASYALQIAFAVAIGVATFVIYPGSPYYIYLITILSGLVILFPVTYVFSRMIWMNLFTRYQSPEQRQMTK